MDKKAQLYCDACNAVYSKECYCKLIKYKKALNTIPDGFDKSPASYQSLERHRENINMEIESRKNKYRSMFLFAIKYILIPFIFLILGIFLRPYFEHNNQNIQKTIPPQIQQQQLAPIQDSTPTQYKPNQQGKKVK
jgi:hypothetical protein